MPGRARPSKFRSPAAGPLRSADPSSRVRLIFPDFLLRHCTEPNRAWLVEIAGFWTPAYLSKKLAQLRAAKLARRCILLLDEERACANGEIPPGFRVLRFRRRVDARAVLAVVEESSAS